MVQASCYNLEEKVFYCGIKWAIKRNNMPLQKHIWLRVAITMFIES